MQDAPMSKIDLLLCRNVLIYLNIDAQNRALARFHFGLKDSGFLCLGTVEMLPIHTSFFTPVNLRQRIFAKVPKGDLNQRLLHKALDRRWL
jgi:two-component system CheB/CheR fusion protein